jgi:ATP-dependent helicase/nuclease subunit B
MAARFVIGRAGSGKTHHCIEQIVRRLREAPLGPPIWWILPKQATFTAERELTCAWGLAGFCRARIVSFEMLGESVLADCGGGAVPQVTSAGRRMILGHLLRRHEDQLRFFKSSARQAGLAGELDRTFSELERCGKDLDAIDSLITDLAGAEPDLSTSTLLDKLSDLRLIYAAYSGYLGQDRLDPHRRLQQVRTCIENCRLIQNADVFVDGFYDFTEFERRILASVAKVSACTEIALLMDPDSPVVQSSKLDSDELGLFFRTEETYRRAWMALSDHGVAIDAPLLLRGQRRFHNPSLAHLEKHLFGRSVKVDRQSQGIALMEAPDRRLEVDAAAREIRALMNRGYRMRDIGVMVRDLDAYRELIDASFGEHGISYFADRRRSAVHHPLPQLIRSLLMLPLHHFPHDALMTMLKCGLCALSLDEADEVENYVLLHRIRGAAWMDTGRWLFRRDKTRGADDELAPAELFEVSRIDALRQRFIAPIRPFIDAFPSGSTFTVRQLVKGLFDVLESFGVRQTIADWMLTVADAGDIQQRGEHEQVWAETVGMLQQLVDVMGDEPVTPEDFLQILDSGLSEFDLALAPATLDQVIVGAVERSRMPELKCIIVMGLSEGEFPRAARDASLISDGERLALRRRNIEIDPDGKRRQLNESFLGYIALSGASELLLATRPAADDEARPMAPSSFFRRIEATFPAAPVTRLERDAGATLNTIGTPRQLVTALMHRVSDGPSRDHAATWASLYQWLAVHECRSDAIDVMRHRAWPALKYDNAAALSPEIVEKMFKSPLKASISRLETFAACPFKHFARYGLSLREREDAQVTAIDLGNVYHGVLERLVRQMIAGRGDWATISEARIQDAALEVGKALRGELFLENQRAEYLLLRVEKTLEQVIASQEACAQRGSGFRPKWAELKFGAGEVLPPLMLTTDAGQQVELRGIIDRVDLLEKQSAVAVIDYKLSDRSLALDEVYHGLSLQLLTYLLVLQANGEALEGKKLTPAAAFYVKLLRRLDSVKHPDDAPDPSDPQFDLKVKPRGVLNSAYLSAFDSRLVAGEKSQMLQARILKDNRVGDRRSSDAAEPTEFSALLRHVQRKLTTLAAALLDGQIHVRPYQMGQTTPCPRCEYRPVCRFELPMNRYLQLTVRGREAVLDELLVAEASHAG